MKLLITLAVLLLFLGCSGLPREVQGRGVSAYVFDGVGESVKIFCDGVLVFNNQIPKAGEFGYSMMLNLPRPNGRMQLVIERRGNRQTFFVNAKRLAGIYVLLGVDGGIRILDADGAPLMS